MLTRDDANKADTRFVSMPLSPGGLPSREGSLRAFVLLPRTGRTHQLRVAMKSLGAPVRARPPLHRSRAASRHAHVPAPRAWHARESAFVSDCES